MKSWFMHMWRTRWWFQLLVFFGGVLAFVIIWLWLSFTFPIFSYWSVG